MKAVLFDLDNTLYPAACDLFSLIDVRINRYMEDVVAIAPAEVDGLRRHYWEAYGTTLQGLILHHRVNPEDYLDYVHDVDVASRVRFNQPLKDAILALGVPSYVFTNGSRGHVERVVAALGLEGVFAGVFDIRIDNYQPKPNPGPYRKVLDQLGVRGQDCIMVEDQAKNLQTAKQFGMGTVLVAAAMPAAVAPDTYIDTCIAEPAQIGQALALLANC